MEPSTCVQSYNVVADILSKFHTAPDWIQALWLVVVLLTVLGLAYCLLRAVQEIAAPVLARREALPGDWALQGHPVFAIYRDPHGRWMVYARGMVRELKGQGPPETGPWPPPPRHH